MPRSPPRDPAGPLAALSPAQALVVGATVGNLLKGGMPKRLAEEATLTIAAFLRRGRSAQEAVDALLAAEAERYFHKLPTGRA